MLMEMDMWSVVREWFLNLLFGRETRAVDGVSSTLRFLKVFCESQQNLHGKSFEIFHFYFFDVSARLKLLAFFATTVELCSER